MTDMLNHLLTRLRTANARQAQAIWREARQLGLDEELDRMRRMGLRSGIMETGLIFYETDLDCGFRRGMAVEFKSGDKLRRWAIAKDIETFERERDKIRATLVSWARIEGWSGDELAGQLVLCDNPTP